MHTWKFKGFILKKNFLFWWGWDLNLGLPACTVELYHLSHTSSPF
jgi:hypothetical protein